MKSGLKGIVGKRIASVVVATSKRAPQQQVFLVFSDGTCFEFWGESFSCGGELGLASAIEGYVESGSGTIARIYGDVGQLVSAPEAKVLAQGEGSLDRLLKRDLQTWRDAREAIDKARARP